MRSELRKQHIDLSSFMIESRKLVMIKSVGASMSSYAFLLPFSAMGLIPWWFAASVACSFGGLVLWDAYADLGAKINQWVSELSTVRTMSEGDGVIFDGSEFKPLKVGIESEEGEHISTVQLTRSQLIELIEARNYGSKLVRAALTSECWPDLNKNWRDKNIQSIAKSLGLTDHRNNFMFEWGGDAVHSGPEVETVDIGVGGVGGSEND